MKLLRYNTKKGFTLIEVLVVIAIIGILASVVMVVLNKAREKARDAATATHLSEMRAQATQYYLSNNRSYGTTRLEGGNGAGSDRKEACLNRPNTVFGDPGMQSLIQAVYKTGYNKPEESLLPIYCSSRGSEWIVVASLFKFRSNGISHMLYCVDYTGYSGETATGFIFSQDGTADKDYKCKP